MPSSRGFISFAMLILVLVLAPARVNAQWVLMRSDADSLVQVGTKHIYNLEFDQANSVFRKVINLYPEHPAGYFLDAMVEWWRISTVRRSKENDQRFLDKIARVVEVSDAMLAKNEFDIVGLFFKGGALGYRGRFYAQRQQWWDAANDGRVGLDILTKCQQLAGGNHDIMLGTGVYNYYSAVLPEEYPILQGLMSFLPRGDRSLGLLQLKTAAKNAKYAATEAKAALLQILLQYENDPNGTMLYAEDLMQRYPKNAYFHRYLGRSYVKLGMWDKIEETWREVVKRCISQQIGYDQQTAREGLYYVGLALMTKRDLEMALRYFYKCDEAGRFLDEDVSGFTVMVNLKIGQIYDIQGKRELAIKQYQKVLGWSERQNSHSEARRYIQSPYRN